jgi:hypothetical protein
LIAFLDQDDYYHPDKLALHVQQFVSYPQVGASYSGRFDLNPSKTSVRDIWNPPRLITLADLVMGFPIAPSDLVLRREWALRPDIEAVHEVFHGGEIIRYGRLYLDGCIFAPVDRALSYHRYYRGRVLRNIEGNCDGYLFAQNTILDDPRCPADVQALRTRAHTMSYLVWAGYALNQNETEVAHKLLRKAAALTPGLTAGDYCQLVQFLLSFNLKDDYGDHEAALRNSYDQLPAELRFDYAQLERAIASGYLMRGTRSLIWNRSDLAEECWQHAQRMQAPADKAYVASVTHQLLNYEKEFGGEATQAALARVAGHLDALSGKRISAQLAARLAANRALRNYRRHDYRSVLDDCVQTVINDPRYIANRGVLSVFVRSLKNVALRGS